MMVWKLAIRPITAHSDRMFAASRAVERAETVEQRFARSCRDRTRRSHRRPPPCTGMLELRNSDHERGEHQRGDAEQQALGHVALRIVRFLRGQRQLLDGEEQPDRERQWRPGCPARPGAGTARRLRAVRRSLPSSPTPMLSAQREKSISPEKMALTQNTASTASASSVTSTDTLNDSSTPSRLRPTNTTYMPIHQSGWNPIPACRRCCRDRRR